MIWQLYVESKWWSLVNCCHKLLMFTKLKNWNKFACWYDVQSDGNGAILTRLDFFLTRNPIRRCFNKPSPVQHTAIPSFYWKKICKNSQPIGDSSRTTKPNFKDGRRTTRSSAMASPKTLYKLVFQVWTKTVKKNPSEPLLLDYLTTHL